MNGDWIYNFTPPKQLDGWKLPSYGGVYIITHLINQKPWKLKYEELYIGETENFFERFDGGHNKHDCCKLHSKGKKLYVSTHKEDRPKERKEKEQTLIEKISTPCNVKRN